MAFALMILVSARELHRHIVKIVGLKPRYRPVRNHLFNAFFAFSAMLIGAGAWSQWQPLLMTGWFIAGATLIGGTTVPCGYAYVNNSRVAWQLRQLLFVSLGLGVFAYALGLF